MKKYLLGLLLFLAAFTMFAQDLALIFQAVPANSTFLLGVNSAEFRKLPVYQKHIANSTLVKEMEKSFGPDMSSYAMFASPDPMSQKFYLITETAQTQQKILALIKNKTGQDPKIVNYGGAKVYRCADGVEISFPKKNLVVMSNTSLEPYFKEKKGLPAALRAPFGKDPVSGVFSLPGEMRKSNPMLASMERIIFRIAVPEKSAASELDFSLDVACNSADGAKQTMMLMQQLQLALGIFMNNTDPELAQDFNKSTEIKTNGTTVSMRLGVSEKMIRQLSLLADPETLKALAGGGDSDFE